MPAKRARTASRPAAGRARDSRTTPLARARTRTIAKLPLPVGDVPDGSGVPAPWGVTAAEGGDGGPVPAAFVAVTVKV